MKDDREQMHPGPVTISVTNPAIGISPRRAQVLRWRLAWVKTDAECAIRGIGTMPTGYSDSEGVWTVAELVDELRALLAPIAGASRSQADEDAETMAWVKCVRK